MRQLLTMTGSDLVQRIRDRSVFIFALVVPLALMYIFNLVFSGLGDLELKPVSVAVSVPAGDQLAGVLPQVLGQVETPKVTLIQADADAVAEQVKDGQADVGVVIPEGFTTALTSGAGPEVKITLGDAAGLEGDIVVSVVRGGLDQLNAGTVATAAGQALGVPPAELARIGQASATAGPSIDLVPGKAANEQLTAQAAVVAGQAGMFLLFTVGFGVLALVNERETGTLARLMSMPMRPGLIVLAKAAVSFILGIVATSVLLIAGSYLFDVSFGSPAAVAVLVLLVVVATTSIMFIIAKVARTAEQAGIAQAIVAISLGMSGGAFFPINATGIGAAILQLNPVAAFTRGLGISSGGGGIAQLGQPILLLLGFTVVILVLARLLPGRQDAL